MHSSIGGIQTIVVAKAMCQIGPASPGILNTLIKDVSNNLWKETTTDGHVTAYPLDTARHRTSVIWQEDPVGNRISYSYSGRLLASLQDSAGRLVSFSYSGGLLQSIQDRWRFLFAGGWGG